MQYVFGPVPSRRLGLSLGVDMVQRKTCTLDCVYCESGRSTCLTLERKLYIDPEKVKAEIESALLISEMPDCITFSGAGEPTLNSGIGGVVDFIKEKKPEIRTALITNGTLLGLREVRDAVSRLDIVIPSLDAVSEEVFQRINRPCPGITPGALVQGIKLFRKESPAEIWVEVFILPGVNDTERELQLLKGALMDIEPHKVHINTLDRPASEQWVRPALLSELERIREYFKPLNAEIIPCSEKAAPGRMASKIRPEDILDLVSRRPCTPDDIRKAFSIDEKTVREYLQELHNSDKITIEKKERGDFYSIK